MPKTRVGSEARTSRNVNSFFARWTSRSPTVTLRRAPVDMDLADADRTVLSTVEAAQDGVDPRPQLLVAERLPDVVVCTELEAARATVDGTSAGEDDDRQVLIDARIVPGFADELQGLRFSLEREVEHQDVGTVVAVGTERVGGIPGGRI